MATKITRTITTTTVNVAYIAMDETGKLAMEEETIILEGKYEDYAKLEKAVHKVRPEAKILKDSIRSETALYAMDVTDFIGNATRID